MPNAISLSLVLLPMILAAEISRADTILIQSGEDTAPYSFIPTLVRYNNPAIYAFDTVDDNMFQHTFETYIRFTLPPGTIPAGHSVTSATFFITYAFDFAGFGMTSSAPGEVHVRQVTQDWDQTTLTWLNRPTVGPIVDSVLGITGFGSMTFDVTGMVEGWTTGTSPNFGLALTSVTERVIGMHSFEAAEPASLKANLLIDTAPISAVPALPPAGLVALGGLLASTAWMQLPRSKRQPQRPEARV